MPTFQQHATQLISSDPTSLRPVVQADLAIFFAQQLDPAANWMAAFVA